MSSEPEPNDSHPTLLDEPALAVDIGGAMRAKEFTAKSTQDVALERRFNEGLVAEPTAQPVMVDNPAHPFGRGQVTISVWYEES